MVSAKSVNSLYAALALGLALVLVASCRGQGASTAGQTAAAQPSPEQIDQIAQWVMGSTRRVLRGNDKLESHLLVIPVSATRAPAAASAPAQTVTSECIAATAILPLPNDPSQILLVVSGTLHLLAIPPAPGAAAQPTITSLQVEPAGMHIAKLLAVAHKASPLSILATVYPAGSDEEQLWEFTVHKERAKGTRAADRAAFHSREEFFSRFLVPRCRRDGTNCLVIPAEPGAHAGRAGQTSIDVEPHHRGQRRELVKLDGAQVVDTAWASRDQIFVLSRCPKKGP